MREAQRVAYTGARQPNAFTAFTKHNARIDMLDVLQKEDTGSVKLQLLNYKQVDPKLASVKFRPRKLKVALYSPHAVDRWCPEGLLTRGLGGSESSVAYLARELAKRSVAVEVYTPHTDGEGKVTLWSGEHDGQEFGVVQKDLVRMSEARKADVIIACRSPYLVRENAQVWNGRPVYCWHQDNGYGNPWLWSPELANAHAGHMHVSDWARKSLMGELMTAQKASGGTVELDPTLHHVLGNGVPIECLKDWDKIERLPHRVIYCSDPTRGLEELLDCWPRVREAVPDAQLVLNLGFGVMLALNAATPGSPVAHRISQIKDRCAKMADLGVVYTGWAPQGEVLYAMKTSAVYAYPGGPMPEGFGVALAQAEACGCEVLCPKVGAPFEILNAPIEWSVQALVEALTTASRSAERRWEVANQTVSKHGWPVVAERFLKLLHTEYA